MSRFLPLLCLVLAGFTAVGASLTYPSRLGTSEAIIAPSTPSPLLKCVPNVADFGKCFPGQTTEKLLDLVNVSGANIQIHRVNGTCGCTTAFLGTHNVLAPKGRCQLRVTLTPTQQSKTVRKHVHVEYTEQGKHAATKLLSVPIVAEMIGYYSLSNSSLAFRYDVQGEAAIDITLANDDIQISEVSTSRSELRATLEEVPQATNAVRVNVTYTPSIEPAVILHSPVR